MSGKLNGSAAGDKEGEYMYVGSNGVTVIDYAITREEVRKRVKRLEVGDRIDLDHQSVIVYMEEKGTKENGRVEGKRKKKV